MSLRKIFLLPVSDNSRLVVWPGSFDGEMDRLDILYDRVALGLLLNLQRVHLLNIIPDGDEYMDDCEHFDGQSSPETFPELGANLDYRAIW
jgi:hypothetical protein